MPTTLGLKTLDMIRRAFLLTALAATLAGGCSPGSETGQKTPSKSIEQVLVEKKPDLMKIPGVAGVYYSKLEDGSPCLKIMVEERTPEVRTGIPSHIDGYPVVIKDMDEIYGKPAAEGGM
jgi:hypothetical protein